MEQSKKRKRSDKAANGRSVPAHASASAGAGASVSVKHLPSEETQLGPIVASTPGLTAPEDIIFTPYRRTVVSRTTDKKRRQILLQSSQHGRLDYIAQEEQAAGNMKHYIAIYDAPAGQFTMTECHKVTLRATLRPSQEELDEEAVLRDQATYASQKMTLGQEFGTKKAKKVIADQTVNAINQRRPGETAPPVDTAQHAVLASLNLKTDGMATAKEIQQEADKSKPRPNDNKNATTPAEVYPIERLVPADDLALMKVSDWQMAAKKGENVKLTKRYIAHRLQKAGTTRDATNLKLLKYMNIMLTWFDALSSRRDTKKLPKQDQLREKVDAAGAILGSLRKHFTDGQQMTKWHIDKFYIYICAIALHIDNFEVDTYDLQEDLRLEPNRMMRYFMELGCKVTSFSAAERDRARLTAKEVGGRKMARLQLPLEFPKVRTAVKGGRR